MHMVGNLSLHMMYSFACTQCAKRRGKHALSRGSSLALIETAAVR